MQNTNASKDRLAGSSKYTGLKTQYHNIRALLSQLSHFTIRATRRQLVRKPSLLRVMGLIRRLLGSSILSLLGVAGATVLRLSRAERLAGRLAGRVSGGRGAGLGRRAARRAVRLLWQVGVIYAVSNAIWWLLDRLAVVHGCEAGNGRVASLLAWGRVLLLHLRALRVALRGRASGSGRRLVVAGVRSGGGGCDVLLVLAVAAKQEEDGQADQGNGGNTTHHTTDNGADWSGLLVVTARGGCAGG